MLSSCFGQGKKICRWVIIKFVCQTVLLMAFFLRATYFAVVKMAAEWKRGRENKAGVQWEGVGRVRGCMPALHLSRNQASRSDQMPTLVNMLKNLFKKKQQPQGRCSLQSHLMTSKLKEWRCFYFGDFNQKNKTVKVNKPSRRSPHLIVLIHVVICYSTH